LGAWARDFVNQKKLGEWVSLTGNISDEVLVSLYASSDCVVIPSRSESIPLVFSEALKFNKEMIVTDVGDMGMLGRRYGVAWVVPVENVMALKEIMKKRVEIQDQGREVNPVRNSSGALNPAGIILKPNLAAEQRGIISNVVKDEDKREELKGLFNIETSVERFLADYV
jgi:glycosyltransferase involved in cell wall biosynthesis